LRIWQNQNQSPPSSKAKQRAYIFRKSRFVFARDYNIFILLRWANNGNTGDWSGQGKFDKKHQKPKKSDFGNSFSHSYFDKIVIIDDIHYPGPAPKLSDLP